MSVSTIEQKWQQELDQALSDDAAAVQQNNTYAAELAELKDQAQQNNGLSRLKNPFIKAAKIVPLHHKQKKLAKNVAARKKHLITTAENTVFSLAGTIVKGSAQEAEYERLKNALEQSGNAKALVKAAANACYTASGTQTMAASKGCPSADEYAKNAVTAIRAAEQALKSFQQHMNTPVPQIKSAVADLIAEAMKPPPLNWDNFSAGNIWRWDLAKRFELTETQLNGIGNELDRIKSALDTDWCKFTTDVITQARKTDPAVEKLMRSVETYLPSNRTPANGNTPKP